MTLATRPAVEIRALLPARDPASDGPVRGGRLAGDLSDAYGSDLWIPLRPDRPTVVANFVSTLDGVVSFNVPGAAGGGEVSGFFEPDRFVMGLLRAHADAVLIGAGTLRDTKQHVWTPGHTHPRSAQAFAALRSRLALAPQPTTVVVSASGQVDLSQRGLSQSDVPVIVITTDAGRGALQGRFDFGSRVEVISAGSERVEAASVIELLAQRGMGLVLCEGGPHLLGQLVGARLVDELFLTIAPQIAGRAPDAPRLGLIEGTSFSVDGAPWSELVDLRRSGDHLFARYRLKETTP